MQRTQIDERFAAGDYSGGTRLVVRQQIAEAKKRQDENLRSAFEEFCAAHPEFEAGPWNFYVGQMRKKLIEAGRDVATATLEDLEWAWVAIKGKRVPAETAPARQVQQPAALRPQQLLEDPTTATAKQLIAEGRVTPESVNGMTDRQYELASRSASFCKAVELLFPKRAPTSLTSGEIGEAVGRANLEASRGIVVTAAEKIAEMERWKEAHFARISTAPQPGSGAPRSGNLNLHQAAHMPKSVSPAQFAAAIQQEREDQKFIEAAAEKSARRKRVMANRRGK